MSLRVALIGFGAIGQAAVRTLGAQPKSDVAVVAILVRDKARLAREFPALANVLVDSLDALLAAKPTLVCECAGHAAVDAYAERVLRQGIDVLVASVGALADAERALRLEAAALAGASQLLLASGAVGGLDWLGSARTAGLTQVIYRGRKPPSAWAGTVADNLLDPSRMDEAQVFFRGSAREAAKAFPKNANVAATVALASMGMDATEVELIADPAVTENVHEVQAQSEAGNLSIRMAGKPDPVNPRTSMMTAHSVVRVILGRCSPVIV